MYWEAIDMRIRAAFLAGAQGLALALLSQFGSVVLLVLAVDAIAFTSLGVGLFLTPVVIAAVRGHANLRRRLAREWCGVEIAAPYRQRPRFEPGLPGWPQRYQWILTDPATWRDMLWMAVDATAGLFLAICRRRCSAISRTGLVLALGGWRPVQRGHRASPHRHRARRRQAHLQHLRQARPAAVR
jgi:putative sensor protein